jgi:NAD(P)-dependent dehydrogenase (short-subunit alcohol dehydrogenase family)
MLSYAGKRVLVTGSGRGIGRSIALLMAKQGADVTVVSRTRTELDSLAEQIQGLGSRAWVRTCDLSDAEDTMTLITESAEEMGGLDVLVNNAGGGDIGLLGPLEDTTLSLYDSTFALNLRSPFFACVRAIKEMTARNIHGSILNIASLDGVFPTPGEAVYGAAKAAMVSFTQSLAIEVGHHGIRVNAIAPSLIDTPLVSEWIATDEARMDRASYFPINRLGTTDDVAAAAAYLCSDEAGWVSGVTLPMAGGQQATSAVFRWVRAHNPVPDASRI